MNEYRDDDYPETSEPEPDPRIIAMHRVVDLEKSYEWAAQDVQEREKKAAILGEELSEARDILSGLLGYPSNANKVKPLSDDGAAYLARLKR